MTRHLRRRHVLAATLIIGFVGAWPVRVDAHATFIGAPASVAADTDVALTMGVPHERDDATFNVGIAIRLPDGWTGVGCQGKPTWTCTIATESGYDVIRFDKDPGAAPAEDETFAFTAHAGGTPGTVSFPTLQTYNTGETVPWIGDPTAVEPAPFLQVTGSAAPTTAVAPTPTSPPTTSAAAAPTVAPAAPTTAHTAAPAPTSQPTTTTSPTTSTVRAQSTTSTHEPTTTTAPPNTGLTVAPTSTEPSGNQSGGSNAGVIAAIVLALLAAGAGAFVYFRRPPSGDAGSM